MDFGHECVVTMHDADTNDNMFTVVHYCVVTLHDAYANDNMTTFTDFHIVRGVSAHCLVLSCLYIVTLTRTVAQEMSLSHHPHVHVHVSVSLRFALTFHFTHFLPHSFHFFPHLKFVDYNLLRTPHKEGMDLSDEFLFSTGYEPTASTSTRPQSSPTCSSWSRRRSSPTKSLLRTPTTMTLHSRVCSDQDLHFTSSLRQQSSASLSLSTRRLVCQSVESVEEPKAQKQDRFLRGRQIAYLTYEYFRVTGANDCVENYADLFTIALRNHDIQEFDSKWDGILLSVTKIPPDDTTEGLYKL